jgi:hypothetical protein
VASRRELTQTLAERYGKSTRNQKQQILEEFTKVTGFHRKHAIRVLNHTSRELAAGLEHPPRNRVYNEAVREALIVLWEAADRICAKRLKQIAPVLMEAMERYGHIRLDAEIRSRLLAISAATMDRLLRPIRERGAVGRRRNGVCTALRKSIPVRTSGGWNDPEPGFFEMDFVAHCGNSVSGSHLHTLVLTDIASGWTETAAMVLREQSLVVETVQQIRARLPFAMLGLDVDNDSAFINETMLAYCQEQELEFTRSRAYRKNDQAWVEQKNGAVVRKLVGYGRLEGLEAARVLAELHAAARLYVNFFQPSFKLKSKTRHGSKICKQYHPPATPAERLMDNPRLSRAQKQRLRAMFAELDPVQLLYRIREAQRLLTTLEISGHSQDRSASRPDRKTFVSELSTAWRKGEIRLTHRKPDRKRRWRTRPDPFEGVWSTLKQWLENDPNACAKELFIRLQTVSPDRFTPGQLRTLQRRVKHWRQNIAFQLVFSGTDAAANGWTWLEQQSSRENPALLASAT